MGWTNPGKLIVNKLVVKGANEGIFVYNGTPAFGNLVLAIASVDGTDDFGNSYLAGLTLDVGSPWIRWLNTSNPAIDGGQIEGNATSLQLTGPSNTGDATVTLDGTGKTSIGDALGSFFVFIDKTGFDAATAGTEFNIDAVNHVVKLINLPTTDPHINGALFKGPLLSGSLTARYVIVSGG